MPVYKLMKSAEKQELSEITRLCSSLTDGMKRNLKLPEDRERLDKLANDVAEIVGRISFREDVPTSIISHADALLSVLRGAQANTDEDATQRSFGEAQKQSRALFHMLSNQLDR